MSRRYIISGEVQGVGFRWFVYKLSQEMKFNGYVRNLSDGTVELVLNGKDHEKILEKVKSGNFYSRVEKIELVEILDKSYDDFDILP